MTDGNGLTRRRLLGSVATVGGAAALGGAGSVAFFSDRERLGNNRLVSGALDLKVSWEEHYSDWSEDEAEFGRMPEPGEEPDLSLPAIPDDPRSEPIELVFSDRAGFMDATLQEQFPEGGLGDADPCEALADVPGDLAAPVIELEDVKPGDFGEVTFDFAACDNPAFLWLQGELIDEAENGLTEAERKDPDEGPGVELADNLRARAWYDTQSMGGGDGESGNGDGDDGNDGGNGVGTLSNGSLSTTSIDSSGATATDLADALVSDAGDISVSNATYTGADVSAGTFTGGESAVGIDEGIVLSSGNVEDVVGPNQETDTTTDTGQPGDPDLDDLANGNTNDAAVLEFDFTVPADTDQVFFNYVFGSEEYNEFVDSSFNDVFGFFLNPDSGTAEETNIATIDDPEVAGEDAVAINNINPGENADLYVDNTDGGADTEMDGFTVVLQVDADVPPGSTNTLKLAVADTADSILDSWVLIEGGSLSTDPDPEPEPEPGEGGDNVKQPGEEFIIEDGTLREVLTTLSEGRGVPLDGDIPAEEGGGSADARNCYSAAPEVHYVAVQWWLPIDHGNQVQMDSVTFDLGFYAEQCRHSAGGVGNT